MFFLKIKDLFHLDPELEIEIAGGYVEHMTKEVEYVINDGAITIQESSAVKPYRYDVCDLPDSISDAFDKLVIFKSYMSSLSDLFYFFDKAFSGTILIDTMFSTGNNSNRFISAVVKDGKTDTTSIEIVTIQRQHPVRVFSNERIRQDKDGLGVSVLTSIQKKLLLKGISI
jgi:hypothetical protein